MACWLWGWMSTWYSGYSPTVIFRVSCCKPLVWFFSPGKYFFPGCTFFIGIGAILELALSLCVGSFGKDLQGISPIGSVLMVSVCWNPGCSPGVLPRGSIVFLCILELGIFWMNHFSKDYFHILSCFRSICPDPLWGEIVFLFLPAFALSQLSGLPVFPMHRHLGSWLGETHMGGDSSLIRTRWRFSWLRRFFLEWPLFQMMSCQNSRFPLGAHSTLGSLRVRITLYYVSPCFWFFGLLVLWVMGGSLGVDRHPISFFAWVRRELFFACYVTLWVWFLVLPLCFR